MRLPYSSNLNDHPTGLEQGDHFFVPNFRTAMTNIANIIIKDNASYVVISTTPSHKGMKWQPHLPADYLVLNYNMMRYNFKPAL